MAKKISKKIDAVLKKQIHKEKKRETGLSKQERARIKLWQPEKITVEKNFVSIADRSYRLIYNHREAFKSEEFAFRFSEVLDRYDYIVGDWGFESLRLRGFFNTGNKKSKLDQRIDTLQDYLYEYCNFGCAFFVLERISAPKGKVEQPFVKKSVEKKPSKGKNPSSKNKNQKANIKEKQTKTIVEKTTRTKPVFRKKSEGAKRSEGEVPKKQTSEKRAFTIRQKNETLF